MLASRDGAALVVMALILAAMTLLGDLASEVPAVDLGGLPVVVGLAGALVAGVGVWALRRRMTGRALSRRLRVQVVPTDDFDPDVEAVMRLAAGLGRSRRAVRGLLDGSASAVRVRLSNDDAGRLRYEMELPEHARGALSTTGYGEVELHDVGRPLDDPVAAPERAAVARVELVLARASTEPLRNVGLDPDPLAAVARAIASLRSESGESAVVCVDLLPVGAGGRRRVQRRLLRQARREHERLHRPRRSMLDILHGPDPGMRGVVAPADSVFRRTDLRALNAKLGSPEPLMEIQVLLRATAPTRGRAVELVQRLASTFDQFAGENHFRARGARMPGGLAFFGADGAMRRGRFDRRLRTGLFRPPRRRMVVASEVAGLLKPPSVRCGAANVVRSGGVVPPPPPDLPTFAGQADLLPLGRVSSEYGDRLVGVPLKDTFFSYMGGRSRYGKTETAVGQFLHLARAGHGCFFLDPHEDALAKIKAYLTDEGLAERVVEINLADPHRQPGWNLFAVHGRSSELRAEQVDAVVDAFASALGWGEQNTRALNLVTQSAQALTDLAARLPASMAPTLFQIPTLLGNDEWRSAVLPYVAPSTRQFFLERFPRLSSEAITPVTNLIDRLRVSPSVAALLGSPESSYDVRAAMDRGSVVLACPGSGSVRDRLIANFLVYDLLHAAKSRVHLPPDQRRPFWVWLDEVQTYDGGPAGTLAALLEQTAKYGLRALLLNQNPERLHPSTLNAVATNRSHLMATALAAKAAALVTREWGDAVKPEVVTRLRRYSYLASVTLEGEISPPFLVHGVPADELHAGAHHPDAVADLDRTIDRTTGRRSVADTLVGLDRHDDAILQALGTPDDGHGPAGVAEPGSGGRQTLGQDGAQR